MNKDKFQEENEGVELNTGKDMPDSDTAVSENSVEKADLSSKSAVISDVSEIEQDPESLIKAMLFASTEYITAKTLQSVLGDEWHSEKIRAVVQNINADLNQRKEPFEIVEVNKSFRFRTRPQYHPWIRKLFRESSARKLSQAALEILALIAYKQPITKAEIEEIRGVNVDGPLKGLLERKLIVICGRSDKIGHPFTYGTTTGFLQYFSINRVPHDLPKLSEFGDLINSTALLPQITPQGEVVEKEVDPISANTEEQ